MEFEDAKSTNYMVFHRFYSIHSEVSRWHSLKLKMILTFDAGAIFNYKTLAVIFAFENVSNERNDCTERK